MALNCDDKQIFSHSCREHKIQSPPTRCINSLRCWHSRDYADNMRLLHLLHLRGRHQSRHLHRRRTIADDVRRDVSSHHQRHARCWRTGRCDWEKSREWPDRSARVSWFLLCRVCFLHFIAFNSSIILLFFLSPPFNLPQLCLFSN